MWGSLDLDDFGSHILAAMTKYGQFPHSQCQEPVLFLTSGLRYDLWIPQGIHHWTGFRKKTYYDPVQALPAGIFRSNMAKYEYFLVFYPETSART
jgi:hypothetical protein